MPRSTRVLTLMGLRPARAAASIPSRTSARRSRRVIAAKCSGSKESSEMLTRFRPASFRPWARLARPSAFVVRARSRGFPSSVRRWEHASDDPLETSAQEGFPAGEADLADPEPLDANAHEAHNLVVRQGFLGGQPVQAFGGHAVGAAQVAAVGERHAQVAGDAPEGVDEPQRRVTRHRICRLRGGNELDRHGATLPRFALCSPLEKPSPNGIMRPRPRR